MTRDQEREELARLLLKHRHGGNNISDVILEKISSYIQYFFYSIADRILDAGYTKKNKDQCELEELARKEARKILSEFEVYGDSYGVPTIADVVESLVKKIQEDSSLEEKKYDPNAKPI